MKRLLAVLAVLLSTFSLALQATTTTNANLRSGPSASAKVLTVIPKSTLVNVGPCTAWCPVTYSGKKGYVSKTILALKATPVPALPVTAPSNGTYTNVDGQQIQRPVMADTKPEGASAQCRDGTYSFSTHRRGTCSHHGGVASWY